MVDRENRVIDAYQAILRALAERIIPGLPDGIRIAILQQTASDEVHPSKTYRSIGGEPEVESQAHTDRTVLQQVIESDQSRSAILHDINGQQSPARETLGNRVRRLIVIMLCYCSLVQWDG